MRAYGAAWRTGDLTYLCYLILELSQGARSRRADHLYPYSVLVRAHLNGNRKF
jgi:hypothetical protein